MKPNKVTVKQKHIKIGTKGSTSYCPIAYSLKEKFKSEYVFVNEEEIWIDGQEYKTPRSAQRFISKFDNHKNSVKPFNFILKENL